MVSLAKKPKLRSLKNFPPWLLAEKWRNPVAQTSIAIAKAATHLCLRGSRIPTEQNEPPPPKVLGRAKQAEAFSDILALHNCPHTACTGPLHQPVPGALRL
jgi:hypothetical protein